MNIIFEIVLHNNSLQLQMIPGPGPLKLYSITNCISLKKYLNGLRVIVMIMKGLEVSYNYVYLSLLQELEMWKEISYL